MEEFIREWLLTPPTHLTEDEAMVRAADAIKLNPDWDSSKGELLVMLMLYWQDMNSDLIFKARFFDWRNMW